MPIDVGVRPPGPEEFLGDDVFIKYDGYHFTMWTSQEHNVIHLDPSVTAAFLNYVGRIIGVEIVLAAREENTYAEQSQEKTPAFWEEPPPAVQGEAGLIAEDDCPF